ncbi:MAG: hypothetical protein PHP31_07315 [Lentimicrobiaceae bacterium]|nr:hypothetical protein [Lentimicrobiaceae bacterium]
MGKTAICPKCNSEYTFQNGVLWSCTQCFFEWDPEELKVAQVLYKLSHSVTSS